MLTSLAHTKSLAYFNTLAPAETWISWLFLSRATLTTSIRLRTSVIKQVNRAPASHVKRLIKANNLYRFTEFLWAEPYRNIVMASEPPNKPGPQTAIEDTVLDIGEVFLMQLPYDMSEQESTDPAAWTASSERSPPYHPCALIMRSTLESTIELELFVLRSFRGQGPREVTERSSTAHEFLPLPYPSREPTMTPRPLSANLFLHRAWERGLKRGCSYIRWHFLFNPKLR